MKLELTHKQTTGLVMTMEMRQAISLLQYSTAELWEYVQQEIEHNPILSFESPVSIPSKNKEQAYTDPIEHIAKSTRSWREELVDQAGWLRIDKNIKSILLFLIDSLDEKGFLPIDETEVAEHINAHPNRVSKARQLLMNFEPMGVGCYNYHEFLLLQVEKDHSPSPFLYELVANHLEDLAEQRWEKLYHQLGLTEQQAKSALREIRSLQPWPLTGQPEPTPSYVTADLVLERTENGFLLKDPWSLSKHIHWDEQLVEIYHEGDQAWDYLHDCYKRARWLIKSIEQRRGTIMNVAGSIIKHQKEYLKGGPLKPLTLKNIAESLHIHESTVSRAVAHKIIQTPDGLRDLKSFFATGFQASHGNEFSSQHVKQLIKTYIDQENSSRPLSDQKIADELKVQHDVRVSRRTVAKYRESLQIPSSSKRKVRIH